MLRGEGRTHPRDLPPRGMFAIQHPALDDVAAMVTEGEQDGIGEGGVVSHSDDTPGKIGGDNTHSFGALASGRYVRTEDPKGDPKGKRRKVESVVPDGPAPEDWKCPICLDLLIE